MDEQRERLRRSNTKRSKNSSPQRVRGLIDLKCCASKAIYMILNQQLVVLFLVCKRHDAVNVRRRGQIELYRGCFSFWSICMLLQMVCTLEIKIWPLFVDAIDFSIVQRQLLTRAASQLFFCLANMKWHSIMRRQCCSMLICIAHFTRRDKRAHGLRDRCFCFNIWNNLTRCDLWVHWFCVRLLWALCRTVGYYHHKGELDGLIGERPNSPQWK